MTIHRSPSPAASTAIRRRGINRVVAVIAVAVSIVASVPALALADIGATASLGGGYGAGPAVLDLPTTLGLGYRSPRDVLPAGTTWESRAPVPIEAMGVVSSDVRGRPPSPPRLAITAGLNASVFAQASLRSAGQSSPTDVSRLAVSQLRPPGAPAEDQLASFSPCGNPNNVSEQARIEVVAAFEELCQAAADDGVDLMISSAYRSAATQRGLFYAAVRKYGSRKAAAKWVARPAADGSCTSMHCAGVAIDLADARGNLAARGPVIDWLSEQVGCLNEDGFVELVACDDTDEPVLRLQLFGFVRPMPYEPWHIELGEPFEPNPIRLDRSLAPTYGTAVAHDAPIITK